MTSRLSTVEVDGYGQPVEPSWREVDWPAHERQIDVDGCRLNYVDFGSGEPVLFVHGMSASWRWFLEVMPAVAKNRRVISLDLPGFGASGIPAEPITMRLYARMVEAFCRELGLGPVPVVGHSMGTIVGLELATHFPQRVAKLTLTGGPILAAGRLLESPLAGARRQPRLAAGIVAELLTVPIPMPRWLAARVVTSPRWRTFAFGPYTRYPTRLPDDLVAQLLIGLGGAGTRAAVRGMLRRGPDNVVHQGIDDITCPVLVIGGADDKLSLPVDVEEFLQRVPHARATVFADTGHWPQHERPAAFLAELTRFLDE